MPLPNSAAPALAVYGNEWGLLELPRRPSTETWSFEQCLEHLKAAGFHGCQSGAGRGDLVRSFGLRFAAGARISVAAEADKVVAEAAEAGADFLTVHLGWGMESDAEIDTLVDAIADASERHELGVYPETHRATAFQDVWRTVQAIQRRPGLRFNGDFSHYYCGQEMDYLGFDTTRQYLNPIIARTRCLHGRISNGQSMQVDSMDPHHAVHTGRFASLWQQVFAEWLASGAPGGFFPFIPELGPPSSGYSITYPNAHGERTEISDRWRETLALKSVAEGAFSDALKQASSRP